VFGFRFRPFLEGISMAFDGSENLQKGPLSTQIPLPRSMLELGKDRDTREHQGIGSSYHLSH
jgi:hypothetical protein